MSHASSSVPTLRTDQLVLRAPEERDIPAWYARATDHGSAYFAGDPIPSDISEGQAWLSGTRQNAADGKRLLWSIDVAGGPDCIGTVGLGLKRPDISFVIGRSHWGQGHATEAARAVVNFGFESLSQSDVGAEFVASNDASRRVLEKLGFRPVAKFIDETDGAACERCVLLRPTGIMRTDD